MKNSVVLFVLACVVLSGCKKKDSTTPVQTLPAPITQSNPPVLYSIITYNGNLIVGGVSDMGGTFNSGVTQWNGKSWSSIGGTFQYNGYSGGIFAMAVYKGNLVVAGVFDNAGGVAANSIAQWNGSSWSALGSGVSGASGAAIYSLAIYNGNLIAIGLFDSAGNTSAVGIAQWNGTTWSALGRGLGSNGQGVCSIIYNNELLVGGELDSAGSISNSDNISEWNGSVWDTIDNRQGSIVGAFNIYNGNLIIRRYSNIQEWDGGNKWTIISDSLFSFGWPNSGNSMGVYNGNLIVTAYNKVDEWNGSSWATIGTFNVPQQLSIIYGGIAVQAVTIYNGKLAVCGLFTPNGVALYDGSSWTLL